MKFSRICSRDKPHEGASGRRVSSKAIHRLHDAVAATLARAPVLGDVMVVGVSGGSDSVALLHALNAIKDDFGFALVAAHFNHRTRGEQSNHDEHFVLELCARLDVELMTGYGEGLCGSNLEERARRQRYAFLEQAACHCRARYIALAHHLDDQAETVLMRLMRGSGLAGAAAMAEIAPIPVPPHELDESPMTLAESGPDEHGSVSCVGLIRPLLGLRRVELLEYLAAIGADYVCDGSNLSLAPMRNRIRHQLLPALERDYAPALSLRLSQFANEMSAVNSLVIGLARESMAARLIREREHDQDANLLDLKDFSCLHDALRPAVIREFVSMRAGSLRHFGRAHIDAILHLCINGPSNGSVDLPLGWVARRHYERLEIRRGGSQDDENSAPRFGVALPHEGDVLITEACFLFSARIIHNEDWRRPAGLFEAVFDADRLSGDLIVRSFEPGDRARPLNLAGTRKIKDVFIQHKLPPRVRRFWPIVGSGSEILWIPGMLRAEVALVGPRTRNMLQVRAKPLEWSRNVTLPGI
ncbi:MAG: tRNA lysidine(34) synthetase TilS [Candidatus Binataceae bacterium]